MQAFWRFASYMLKYRFKLGVALACALVSAVCFGGGISISLPILRVIFRGRPTVDERAVTTVQRFTEGLEADTLADRYPGALDAEAVTALQQYAETLDPEALEQVMPSAATGPGLTTFRQILERFDAQTAHDLVPDWLVNLVPEGVWGGLVALVVLLVLLTFIGSYTAYVHAFLSMKVSIMAVTDIRTHIFSGILRLPLLTLLGEPVSDKISRIMRDSNDVGRGMTALASKTLAQVLRGVSALAVGFITCWQLCLIALLLVPVLVLVARWFGKHVRRTAKKALAQYARLLGIVTQSLQGVRVVKVYTAERCEMGRLRQVNREFLAREFPLRRWKAMGAPTIQAVAMVGFGGIILFAGSRILAGRLEPATVATTLIALGMALTTMKPLTFLWNELNEAAAAAQRLREMENLPPEEERLTVRKPRLPAFSDRIEFTNVSFQYPKAERPALEDIDLCIPRGSTFAFVGPNGCGKTTLLSLVSRLFDPTAGHVLMDGRDVREFSLRSLRNQIGVVTQETVMFVDTIANNIGYGKIGATQQEIKAAAEQSYAQTFIERTAGGFDAVVGDSGSSLSGGERQRLAIARAILRDPAILILDEATSMIDADSEALITAALDEFCSDRTSLIIAHRLSTVINADQIVVMNQGRIMDVGTHQELISRCVLYQQLCRTQLVEKRDKSARATL